MRGRTGQTPCTPSAAIVNADCTGRNGGVGLNFSAIARGPIAVGERADLGPIWGRNGAASRPMTDPRLPAEPQSDWRRGLRKAAPRPAKADGLSGSLRRAPTATSQEDRASVDSANAKLHSGLIELQRSGRFNAD